MKTPQLETRRLHLSPVAPSDLHALHAHWIKPQVQRFLWDGQAPRVEQVSGAIRASEEMFREHGAGLWTLREDGELVGCIGFWFYHEPPQLELLVSLSPERWGQGYAVEAADALIDFVFDELQWDAVQASADAPNEASLRLLRRLGMSAVGEAPGEFGAIEIYRISRDAWRQRAAKRT